MVLRRHGVLDGRRLFALAHALGRCEEAQQPGARSRRTTLQHRYLEFRGLIVGLTCVKLSERGPTFAFLRSADAFAALIVAGIVFFICGELGLRTVQTLLTRCRGDWNSGSKPRRNRPGILDCHQVRARYSGSQLFVDATCSSKAPRRSRTPTP